MHFARAPFANHVLSWLILFTVMCVDLRLFADTQPAPINSFFYIEEPVKVTNGDQSESRVIYVSESGCLQLYEKRDTLLYHVTDKMVDAKAVGPLVRKLIAEAKTNTFERLPAEQIDSPATNESQVVVAYAEESDGQREKHGRRLSGQLAVMLRTLREHESKFPILPTTAGVFLCAMPISDNQNAPPVHDLRTASAAKSIFLSRAVENPYRLVFVPAGRNPFDAFVASFFPGDSLKLQVSGKCLKAASFTRNTE